MLQLSNHTDLFCIKNAEKLKSLFSLIQFDFILLLAAAVAAAAAASHGFPQIKSDVMYPHHTSSQSIMSSRANQVTYSAN